MNHIPKHFFLLVSFGVTLTGCDQIDIRPATANDCKQVYDHSLSIYCGKGLLSSACKATLGGLGTLFGAEDSFIGSCTQHATKKDVACTLKQTSQKGIEVCLADFHSKVQGQAK